MPETKHRSSRKTDSRRVHIRLDAVADRNLKEASTRLNSLLSMNASQSLIIRRALRLYATHLREIQTQMDSLTPKERAEVAEKRAEIEELRAVK